MQETRHRIERGANHADNFSVRTATHQGQDITENGLSKMFKFLENKEWNLFVTSKVLQFVSDYEYLCEQSDVRVKWSLIV